MALTLERVQHCISCKRTSSCQVISFFEFVRSNKCTFSPAPLFMIVDIKKPSTVAICVFSKGLTIPQNAWLLESFNFLYLAGNKRERQYSSEFVDMRKSSFKTNGVFAIWVQGFKYAEGEDMVKFKQLEFFFKPGYLSIDNCMCTINDTFLKFNANCSLSISSSLLTDVLPD